jgi:hypothetical protein
MKLGASKLTSELDRYIDKLQLFRGMKLDHAVYDLEQEKKRKKF